MLQRLPGTGSSTRRLHALLHAPTRPFSGKAERRAPQLEFEPRFLAAYPQMSRCSVPSTSPIQAVESLEEFPQNRTDL